MLFATMMLLAENPPAGQTGDPQGGFLNYLPIFALIMLGAWLFLVRPARAQEKQHQALLSALKKSDKVVTAGGIVGVVATNVKPEDKEVILKIDENSNVRLRVTKASITQVIRPEEAKDKEKEQKDGGS